MTNKTLTYKLGKGIVSGTKALGKGIEALASAGISTAKYIKKYPLCFTYPILGNLSGQVQEKIQKVTKNKYNPEHSSTTSIMINMVGGYAFALPFIAATTSQDEITILATFVGGIAYGFGEGLSRAKISGNKDNFIVGSLPGKIISLPIEAGLGIYDGIKGGEK